MRTPERRTFTGCKCRMSEPRTASTRLRLVLGMPTRKTDFQICELTMFSWRALTLAISKFDERLRIRPFASFLVKLLRLVDDHLPVREIDEDLRALERARRRSLEVHSRFVVAAAVARTLELILRRQPVRRPPKVRAHPHH